MSLPRTSHRQETVTHIMATTAKRIDELVYEPCGPMEREVRTVETEP